MIRIALYKYSPFTICLIGPWSCCHCSCDYYILHLYTQFIVSMFSIILTNNILFFLFNFHYFYYHIHYCHIYLHIYCYCNNHDSFSCFCVYPSLSLSFFLFFNITERWPSLFENSASLRKIFLAAVISACQDLLNLKCVNRQLMFWLDTV